MENLLELLSSGFDAGQKSIDESEARFKKVEASLQAYLVRAKETLGQKHVINPKPLKRFMKTIADESEESGSEDSASLASLVAKEKEKEKEDTPELRPVRTAKSKANQNLKEVPMNVKMRNDNNVVVKTERVSSINRTNSRESIKENKEPEKPANQKRKSPDEGIQSACDSPSSERASKRSNSVEVISAKIVEIDLSHADDNERMPPPSLTKKGGKKTAQAKTSALPESNQPTGLRVTRSKIKQEKVSIVPAPFVAGSISATSTEVMPPPVVVPLVMAPPPVVAAIAPAPVVAAMAPPPVSAAMAPPSADSSLKTNEIVDGKRPKKKYPMPILIKMERVSDELSARKSSKNSNQSPVLSPPVQPNDETFNVPASAANETFQVAPTANEPRLDATVTLSKNPNESLMTEDNDDEAAIEPPPLPPKPKSQAGSGMKLKKNEVFNPYMSSPVKQRVQAFEKHANNGSTPERFHTLPSKFGSLKSGTPSKIATLGKTTPLSVAKQRFLASVTGSNVTSSAPANKAPKPLKKMHSLSQESLDDQKKAGAATAQLMEERRKAREEKQRLALQAREAMEKEKRELAIRQQQERDEKYRKLMKEKEEKQRMEALKKNLKKEKQAKKFAEEKARKDEFAIPKPVDAPALVKNDSLRLKMQKQLLLDRSLQHQKEEAKNCYGFDMLQTDDSTDDESKPSKKRPEAPEWSKKRSRKPFIVMQSAVPASMLDNIFSSRPISVDLREIFPAIEARKLIRNSSAIWRTPPKQY